MNLSSKEIFERFGEPFYRALETMAVKELSEDRERKVISLWFRIFLFRSRTRNTSKKLGTMVYLKGSYETLKKRLENSSSNPHWKVLIIKDKIKKLLKQRDPVYEKFADVEMITGVKPFDELIGQLEEKLKA